MALVLAIWEFPGRTKDLSQHAKWARRRLYNKGEQYDIRSRLDAKRNAAKFTDQPPSLLRQFLKQTEPPEEEAGPRDLPGMGSEDGEGSYKDDGTDVESDEPSLSIDSDDDVTLEPLEAIDEF